MSRPTLKPCTAFAGALLLLWSVWIAPTAQAETEAEAIYIIFDGSGSMWGQLSDGTHKITAAREVLDDFVAGDFGDKELALRAYGHRRKGDCADTELVVPFSPAAQAADRVKQFADGVNPTGKTPIGRSLRAALDDFGTRSGEIILISDGIETCDDDPCALVRSWRDKDVAIKVHVVGLGLGTEERKAMQCISDAAGTEYQDAGSAEELAEGLANIQAQSQWQVLTIRAANSKGEKMRVEGVAVGADGTSIDVGSNGHNSVPPGTHEVTVGVRTRNGNLYRPVTQTVEVRDSGSTEVHFEVPEPPSVKANFVQRGEAVRGSLIRAYQDGSEALSFRPKDRAYVDPGTYEFRAKPNADNPLSVTESFTDGDHKEILFELQHTVRATIKMVAAGSGMDFRSNYELWQDGERKYKVHWSNGVQAIPGTYDLRLPLRRTPYVHPGLVLTDQERQEFRIEVPVGHLIVRYQNSDGSAMEDARCNVERSEGGRWVSDKISMTGERIPLVPGTYRVRGWSHLGTFEDIEFQIGVGDEKEVILRAAP